MTDSRGRHLANIGYSVASWGIPLVLAFFATRILIERLGVSTYGVYTLVLAIIGFGFTTGIGRVTAKYIPELRSQENSQLESYLSFTFLLTIVAAFLQGSLLALITPILVEDVFKIEDGTQDLVKLALYLTCLIGPAMMIGQYFQSSLQGLYQFRTLSLITNASAVALNLGAIVLALSGFGVISIIALNLSIAVLSGIVFFAAVKRSLPEFRIRFSFDRSIGRTVLTYAGSIVIYQIMASTLFIFERGFVVRKYGAEALTYYVVPLMLGLYLHALLFSFSQAAIPVINEKLNDIASLTTYYQNITKAAIAIAVFIALAYFCYGEAFLNLWLGKEFSARSYPLLVIHGSAFALIVVSLISWISVEAFRKPAINAMSSIASTVVAIGLILYLENFLDVRGVAMGRVAGAAVVLPLIFYVEKEFFGTIFYRFWLRLFGTIVIAGFLVWIVSKLTIGLGSDTWPSLFMNGLVGVLVYIGVLGILGFLPTQAVLKYFNKTN